MVRHEDLVADPTAVLQQIEAAFGLPRVDLPAIPSGAVLPAPWDHSPVRVEEEPFDATYYQEQRYLRQLDGTERQIVARVIDWTMLEPFGYHPTPCEEEGELRHAI